MSKLEDIADGLAKRALDLVEKTGDETIEKRTADEIGALSPTLQEAYTTAVRIRKAEIRASRLLDKYQAGEAVEKAAISSQPQD
ncbi:MAG: hypothetical protein HKP37_08665 [Boseongicola sp.]|nr:hypothetical protein [Boseongicola sp.]NNL18795.1 hypothetical protein [Boseongicola sp.]